MNPVEVNNPAAVADPAAGFEAQFEQALDEAITTSGIMVGSTLMSQMLTQFAEANAELDA